LFSIYRSLWERLVGPGQRDEKEPVLWKLFTMLHWAKFLLVFLVEIEVVLKGRKEG
jgi:hypothetical protein